MIDEVDEKMVSRSFTLPRELDQALADYAAERGLYVSQVLRWAAQNYLQRASSCPAQGPETVGKKQ